MPDIAMCEGIGCPMRDACYRYTATPSEFRQSYFMDIPYNKESGECEHYWEHADDGGCGHDQNENYHDTE